MDLCFSVCLSFRLSAIKVQIHLELNLSMYALEYLIKLNYCSRDKNLKLSTGHWQLSFAKGQSTPFYSGLACDLTQTATIRGS